MILKEVFAVILKGFFCSDIERGDFNRKRVGRVSINIGKRGRLPTKRKNCKLQTPWEILFERGKCKKQVSEHKRTELMLVLNTE